MTSPFDALSGPGKSLKAEPADAKEFTNLRDLGLDRLKDAKSSSLTFASRFDLAYNAAHSMCLAALRWHGYRSTNRYIVFQLLPYTLGPGPEVWRVLAKCHDVRNLAEYEGRFEADERLLTDLIAACERVAEKLRALKVPS